jgi:DNA primase
MISKDTILLVRERTDIVAVVTESVPTLKKRGKRFLGLCPFHKEKTPSFNVNPDTGMYHCFGCKEGGDAIRFVERVEGLSFSEAVRQLAERAGIQIEEEKGERADEADRHRRERDAFYSAMSIAAGYYEEQLRTHPNAQYAIDEMARREMKPGDDAAQAFRLGYAPPGWDGLASFLKRQGVSPAVGETVGLVVPRSSGSGYYDRFRHRLMFAVIDVQGRVVAFSGRALKDLPPEPGATTKKDETRDPPPKYINSPESPIYTKGSTLFGLWQARHAIRQKGRAVLVEGNFDVVSLHARGVTHVVAPLGTAFTIDQAKLLRRYCPEVTLLFDADAAGRKATMAAEEPCRLDGKNGLDAKVATLPDKTDPDEFVRQKGAPALELLLSQSKGLPEHLIDMEFDPSFNPADAREKSARVERIVALLARQSDPLVASMLRSYADQAAGRLDIVRSGPGAFAALQRRFMSVARAQGRGGGPGPRGPSPSEAKFAAPPPGREERKAIVGALLDFPVLLDDPLLEGVLAQLSGESARIVAAIRQNLVPRARGQKTLNGMEFLAQLSPAIQAFASERLAAPAHETIEHARETVMRYGKKLRDMHGSEEAREAVLEQHRDASDWDAGVERLKLVDAVFRQKQGIRER